MKLSHIQKRVSSILQECKVSNLKTSQKFSIYAGIPKALLKLFSNRSQNFMMND